VEQAIRQGQITLLPGVFGRGLDFTCYDKRVSASGGVAVLQFFVSGDVSEETQIKGRTCRQGETGSYKMIICAERHLDVGAKAKDELREAQTNGQDSVYKLLDERRKARSSKGIEEQSLQVQKNHQLHEQSMKLQEEMLCGDDWTPSNRSMLLSKLQGFTAGTIYHAVFCLDESGSMNGNKWTNLQCAFRNFVQQRTEHGSVDKVSVVQFANRARVTLQEGSLDEALHSNLEWFGGGTRFAPPLKKTHDLLLQSQAQGLQPVVIFMSDGSNFDDDECQQQLDVLKNKYPGLKFHAVFFGEDTGQEKLKGMALQFTRGKFHLSKNAPELLDTFKKIAAEITNF